MPGGLPVFDSAWGLPQALGLTDDVERLRVFLAGWQEGCDPEVLPIVRHQLSGRAKYFRPVTIFACHRALDPHPPDEALIRRAAALELTQNVSLIVDVRLDLPEELGGSAPVYAQPLAADIGALAWLRLSLPTSTPPGTYGGTIRLGERPHKVAVEVEPRLQLRFSPVGLVLRGAPGSAVSGGFTLFNTGNVAFEVRRIYAFGVFDVDGLDNAFGQTFRARMQPGERRIDRFAEALAEGHGGLVRARIVKGGGQVPPNSIREVAATFRLPDRMRPGRAYAGTLPLDYARYGIRIETTGPQREEEEPE